MQLRHQLTLTSCAAWVVVLGLLYFIVSERLLSDARATAEQRLGNATADAVRTLETHFLERRGDLIVLNQVLDHMHNGREQITAILTNVRDAYGSYEWLRVCDTDGRVLADTNQMGIGTRAQLTVTEPAGYAITLNSATLQQDIHALLCLREKNRAVMASVPLQRVQRNLINPTYWPSGTNTELIVTGVVVASTNPTNIGSHRTPRVTAITGTTTASKPPQRADDDTVTISAFTVDGWEFRSSISAPSWQAPIRPVLNAILLAAVVGACGGSLLVGWMTVRITRPLAHLAIEAATPVQPGQGRFSLITVGEPSEVTQLRTLLVTMEHQLRDRISALQQAGERMRLAAQVARLGAWDYQLAEGKLNWNEGMHSLYGCDAAHFTGRIEDWSNRVFPEDLAYAQQQFHICVNERRSQRFRFRICRDDGLVRWIDSVIEPICDSTGAVTTTFGINLDITEYMHNEEALRTSLHAAEAAMQAKSDFLATMSHEIRTPLNGVIGMIDLLLGSDLAESQHDMARTIHNSGSTLLGIVNDILDYSKIEAGKLELEQQPYDPSVTIRDVIALLRPQIQHKDLRLEFIPTASVPPVLLGDAGRVRQVLFNILGNALKFTAHGAVRVGLSRHEHYCRLTVQDTGIGIAAEDLGKLFRRFSQVDATMTRRFGGTGLGLAISHRLVEAMGGTIDVQSIVGTGSTFIISLPLPDPSVRLPDPVTTKTTVAPARPLRVLLAEDNLVNQKVASGMLARLGHHCEIAPTGTAAVAAWRTGEFDLILMDMQMPEMDGLEATRLIRSEETPPQRIPIVALTANALAGDRAACLAAGMLGVVSKPVTSASLAQALREFAPA